LERFVFVFQKIIKYAKNHLMVVGEDFKIAAQTQKCQKSIKYSAGFSISISKVYKVKEGAHPPSPMSDRVNFYKQI
jgi:FAD synthase